MGVSVPIRTGIHKGLSVLPFDCKRICCDMARFFCTEPGFLVKVRSNMMYDSISLLMFCCFRKDFSQEGPLVTLAHSYPSRIFIWYSLLHKGCYSRLESSEWDVMQVICSRHHPHARNRSIFDLMPYYIK